MFVRRMSGRVPAQQSFKEDTCKEPVEKVIQTDDTADIPSGIGIVPGAHIIFLKQRAGEKFADKDTYGIDAAP